MSARTAPPRLRGRRLPAGPIRVLMVTPHYLPEIGGVEHHVHEVATRIAASSEAAVTVLTTDAEGRLPARDRVDDIDVRRVRAHPRGHDWLLAPGIVPIVGRGGWDVIHVQSYHTFVAPLAMATAAGRRIPYVVTFHGGGHSRQIRQEARPFQRRVLRPLLARASALVALAQFEIDEYGAELGLPPERFVFIPNGVHLPPPPERNGPERGRAAPAGPLIASIGRLERYKGHQRVLAAFQHLRASEPAAQLWIAGSGPYESELRRLSAELGIADVVDISAVAADDRAEMARRLSEVDLVVLLSDFETHPMAALEALSLGCGLLVSDGSGLGELAARGLTRAIDRHAAPEVVAAAIVRELRDPLKPPHVSLPTWDDCATELLALYRRVTLRTG